MVDTTKRIRDWCLRTWLPGEAGETVLDVGCSNASYFPFFYYIKNMEYTGCDNDKAMLERAERDNPDARVVYGELPNLAFADHSFDLVFCARLLHHIDDQAEAIRELMRVARRYVVVHLRSVLSPPDVAFRGTHYHLVKWATLEDTRNMLGEVAKGHTLQEYIVNASYYPAPDGKRLCVDPFYVIHMS